MRVWIFAALALGLSACSQASVRDAAAETQSWAARELANKQNDDTLAALERDEAVGTMMRDAQAPPEQTLPGQATAADAQAVGQSPDQASGEAGTQPQTPPQQQYVYVLPAQ